MRRNSPLQKVKLMIFAMVLVLLYKRNSSRELLAPRTGYIQYSFLCKYAQITKHGNVEWEYINMFLWGFLYFERKSCQ